MAISKTFLFALAFCLAVCLANGLIPSTKPYLDVSLEQLSGEWIGDMDSQLLSVFGPYGPDFLCTTQLTDECAASLTPGHAVLVIDTATNSYHTVYNRFDACVSLEAAQVQFPVCASDGVHLGLAYFETFATLDSYKDGQFSYLIAGKRPSCMPWLVYVEDGLVKADIEQKCKFDGSFLDLFTGTPFICSEEEVECEMNFKNPMEATMHFWDTFTAICLSGECLKIAELAQNKLPVT